jgi:hypothetical protein
MSYIVIRWPCDREHLPTRTHDFQHEAVQEAERLAAKHPNAVFRVAEFMTETRAQVTVETKNITSICGGEK